MNGTNYLLPVDADLKSEMDVKLGAAINIDLTLEQTMSDAKVKLVFLDACRDNPFAAKIRAAKATRSVNVQTGLAEMKSGEGTLIAFATGPGQTALDGEEGTNSPFTRALMANIASPGVEIQQAMTRVRAQVSEETGKRPAALGPHQPDGLSLSQSGWRRPPSRPRRRIQKARPRGSASEVELEFWRSIKDSNKTEELNAYLTNYPNGTFKSIALARIASLQDGPSTATRNLTTGVGVDPRPSRRKLPRAPETGSASTATAPRRGAPADRPRLRHQASRQVRWRYSRGDHPLAGGPRLSEERLSQCPAAQRTAVRDLATRVTSDSSASSDDEPLRQSRRRSGGGVRHYNNPRRLAAPAPCSAA